jgi:glutamate racemase
VNSAAPIGVFDSGLGGLSVAREIRAHLPAEDILYLADTAYCPYGGRPLEEIRARSLAVAGYLVDAGAKAVVVACNSATGAGVEALREAFDVPIVGMEPAVKPAAAATRNLRVGVMATEATIGADRFARLMREHAHGVVLFPQECPGLVELVEAGEFEGARVEETLRTLLEPMIEAEVDTVVLGCTHYPFLRGAISRVMGNGVALIDTGAAVARQTGRLLAERGALADHGDRSGSGKMEILTTGGAGDVERAVEHLLGEDLPVRHVDV